MSVGGPWKNRIYSQIKLISCRFLSKTTRRRRESNRTCYGQNNPGRWCHCNLNMLMYWQIPGHNEMTTKNQPHDQSSACWEGFWIRGKSQAKHFVHFACCHVFGSWFIIYLGREKLSSPVTLCWKMEWKLSSFEPRGPEVCYICYIWISESGLMSNTSCRLGNCPVLCLQYQYLVNHLKMQVRVHMSWPA